MELEPYFESKPNPALTNARLQFQNSLSEIEERLYDLRTRVLWNTRKDGTMEPRFPLFPQAGLGSMFGLHPQTDDPEKIARVQAMSPLFPEMQLIARGLGEQRQLWRSCVSKFHRRLGEEFGLDEQASSDYVRDSTAFSTLAHLDPEFCRFLKRFDPAVNEERQSAASPQMSSVHQLEAKDRQRHVQQALEVAQKQLNLVDAPPEKVIWLGANRRDGTQFRHWKQNASGQSKPDNAAFLTAIAELQRDPATFLEKAARMAKEKGKSLRLPKVRTAAGAIALK